MEPIFLDIETTTQDPEPWMIPNIADLEPPANSTKRRREKASTLDELRDRTSLDPFLGGTVICVAVARGNGKPAVLVAPTADEAGELHLLQQVEKALAKYHQNPIVTWNGGSFDLPFLAKRAIRHGLYSLAARMHQDKPWNNQNTDLFRVWQQHDRTAKGKLVHVAAFFGLAQDFAEITGKDVAAAIAAGDTSKVVAHCAADVERLRAIYWRMRAASWVQGADPIPDELPVRPPRVTERTRLLQAIAELMVEVDRGTAKRAADMVGVLWEGEPPNEDGPALDGVAVEGLRAYLDALQALRLPQTQQQAENAPADEVSP